VSKALRRAKRENFVRLAALAAPAFLAAAGLTRQASAIPLYWDDDLTATGNNAGTGANLGGSANGAFWDTGGQTNWWDGASASDQVWADGNEAVFTGTAATVNLVGAKAPSGITFNIAGYTLAGSAVNLQTGGVTVNTINNTVSATIGARMIGSLATTMTKSGAGTLILANPLSWTGGYPTANSDWLSDIHVTGGILQISNGGSSGSTPGYDSNQFNSAFPFPTALPTITLDATTKMTVQHTSGGSNRSTVNITGAGDLEIGGNQQETYFGNVDPATIHILAAGRIRIGAGGNVNLQGTLGNSAVTNNGNVTTGLTFQVDNANFTSGFTQTGTGGTSFDGANTVSLTADNSGYTGATRITTGTGTMSIGNGGTTGAWGAVINFTSTGNLNFNRSNAYNHSAAITQTAGGGKVNKLGGGTLTMSGAVSNTYTGLTDVQNGEMDLSKTAAATAITGPTKVRSGATLKLLGTNQIADASAMELNGGTFSSNNNNETLGVLTLTDNSVVDLGAGSLGLLTFANSSGATWTGGKTLTINNWDGNPAGGGTEQIKFDTSNAALTVGQLAQVFFQNPAGFPAGTYTAGFASGNPGELVPTPEPGSIALLGIGSLAALRRRRRHA